MGTGANIEEILGKFVLSFVRICEGYFDEYHKRFVEKIPKQGKTVDNLVGGTEMVTGVTELLEGSSKATTLVSIKLFQKTAGRLGAKFNRDDLKKLSSKLKEDQNKPEYLRNILVDSGIEIFKSFESQFTRLNADDNCWETAIGKVAHDVVNRVINHLKKNPEKELSVKTIFEGVLFGQSKVYRSPNSGLPNLFRGHSVIIDEFELKTPDLFRKVGLLQDSDYYRYRSKTWSNPDLNCVGFRILFAWEDVTANQKYTKLGQAPPGVYKNILTDEILQKVRQKVVYQLEDAQTELGDLEHILEDMRNDAAREADELKDLLKMNAEAVDKVSGEVNKINKTLDSIQQATSKSKETAHVDHGILLQLLSKVNNLQNSKKNNEGKIVFDIMEPTELFKGRIDERKRLDRSFQRRDSSGGMSVFSRMTCISGLGGMGKSEMAKQYICDCRLRSPYILSKFRHFIWINAESKDNLIDSFQRLAEDELGMKIVDGNRNTPEEIERMINYVYKSLADREDCLVVLDNAENEDYLYQFLPLQVTDGNIPYFLLTSRVTEWDKWTSGIEQMPNEMKIEPIHLEEMKMEEAAEFVKDGLEYDNDCEDIEIKELVVRLQFFPLAIQQAISYIFVQKQKNDSYKISDYLKEFEDKTQELLSSDKFQVLIMDNMYSWTTFTTWNLTVDKIKSDKGHGELAVDILNIMAYLSAEKIQKEFFFKLPDVSEDDVRESIGLLVRYSMIKGNSDLSVLRIHRLVQLVTRIKLDIDKSKTLIEAVYTLLTSTIPEDDTSESYTLKKSLLPHLEAFQVHLKDWIVRHLEYEEEFERDFLVLLLFEMGAACTLLGKSWRAKQIYEDALAIVEKGNEKGHRIIEAILKVELCPVLEDLGEHAMLLQNIEEALPILEEYYNGDNRFANALEHKAMVLSKLGIYDHAEETYKIMLRIYEATGSTLDIATTKINLSALYGMKKNIQEQKRMLDEAIPVFERNYSSDHIKLAFTKYQLSLYHHAIGEYDTEIELLENCLLVYKEVLGDEAQFVGRIMLLLGFAYRSKGEYEKGKECSVKAFNICKNHYRDEHHIDVTRYKLFAADAIGDSGDRAEQLRLLLSALTGYEKCHEGGSWETANLLVKIATTYEELGQQRDCIETLGKAVAMMEIHLRDEEKDRAVIDRLKSVLTSKRCRFLLT